MRHRLIAGEEEALPSTNTWCVEMKAALVQSAPYLLAIRAQAYAWVEWSTCDGRIRAIPRRTTLAAAASVSN